MGQLQDLVALVTGGTSGIGAATAERFAREGATVLTADIAGEADFTLDVRDEGAVAAAVASIVEAHDRIDIVVNAAGGTEGGSAYNASKGGVIVLTKSMAIDYGKTGIRVNAVCPGGVRTPLLLSMIDQPGMEDYRSRMLDAHKLGRFGEPEEIANAVLFLASSEASFMTGTAMVVDGGMTAGLSGGFFGEF